ncbi:WapI family immunity protein [Terrisporobacter petrolearius]|uniref:WapI family immunity protein n=1 Tax=Terrisporobacter petrolearius TaxID=1460447 RepID=UPI003B00A1A9
MKHRLSTENFTIEIEINIFEQEIDYPINSTLNIYVESDKFGARTTMDIDIKEFAVFVCNLKHLYDFLDGSARLEEAYSIYNYIEFWGTGNGHIVVKGCLNNHCRNGFEQELSFENEFDQTYLKIFVKELYQFYKKYLHK